MPVADHPVHPRTAKTGDKEHCHNNRYPVAAGYWAQDGWIDHRPVTEGGQPPLRTPNWVWVPSSETANKCMANNGQKLKTCEGCDECR